MLSIGEGTLDVAGNSPWRRKDEFGIPQASIKTIKFTGAVELPASSKNMFSGSFAPGISIEGMDKMQTSNVTNMEFMFAFSGMTTFDLSSFDTSNVTSMKQMFSAVKAETLDLSSFDTSNVTDMKAMFSETAFSKLVLGPTFSFKPDAMLSSPVSEYSNTGKWIREDGKSSAHTPADFIDKYGSGDLTAGTYVAEISTTKKKRKG